MAYVPTQETVNYFNTNTNFHLLSKGQRIIFRRGDIQVGLQRALKFKSGYKLGINSPTLPRLVYLQYCKYFLLLHFVAFVIYSTIIFNKNKRIREFVIHKFVHFHAIFFSLQWNGTKTYHFEVERDFGTDYGICCWYTPQFNFSEILGHSRAQAQ